MKAHGDLVSARLKIDQPSQSRAEKPPVPSSTTSHALKPLSQFQWFYFGHWARVKNSVLNAENCYVAM